MASKPSCRQGDVLGQRNVKKKKEKKKKAIWLASLHAAKAHGLGTVQDQDAAIVHNCYEEAGQSSDRPGLGTVSGHDNYMYNQVRNRIRRLYPGKRQDN